MRRRQGRTGASDFSLNLNLERSLEKKVEIYERYIDNKLLLHTNKETIA